MGEIKLFPHQKKLINGVKLSWLNGNKNVIAVLPTGGGKSYCLAELAKQFQEDNKTCIVLAHRDVLISQLSESLCEMGVTHTFIASKSAVRDITNNQVKRYGHSFYNEKSSIILASVPTLSQRIKKGLLDHLAPLVDYWIQDESHHLLSENIWGKCVAPFINAKGVGFTATPVRADQKCLGHNSHGVFHDIIVGSTMDELIKIGRLSPYRIYTVPSKLDLTGVNITSGGDYNQTKLAAASDKADITGDAVEHYKRLAYGKQAITFCVNIDHAEHVAKQFNDAGIESVALSSKNTS